MKNSDAFARKFGGETGNDPDFFKLMIEALGADGKPIGTLDYYLADFYRSYSDFRNTRNGHSNLSNISGKIVAEYDNISNNQSINGLEGLSSGVYFIRIMEGKNQFTPKLIKK